MQHKMKYRACDKYTVTNGGMDHKRIIVFFLMCFYFDIISNLQKSCKTVSKDSLIPFT